MESHSSFEREGKMNCNTDNKHKHVSSVKSFAIVDTQFEGW